MDLQKLGMDGRDYDRIPRLVSMYKTASIRRAQYVKTEERFLLLYVQEISVNRKAFVVRMKFMIRSWRTYLTSIVKKLLLNNKKVDEFLAMVEHAKKIYSEGEVKDAMNHKQKHLREDTNLHILPNLRCEMQCADDMMHATPPQPSQMRATWSMGARRRLQYVDADFNIAIVHDIGKTSLIAIMDLNNTSD
jgi:hypothetical protein